MSARMTEAEYRDFYYQLSPSQRRGIPKPVSPVTPQTHTSSHKARPSVVNRGLRGGLGTLGRAGSSIIGAMTSFGGGRFKGIRHPDSLLDPKMRWLYNSPANISPLGEKPTKRELYFGKRRPPSRVTIQPYPLKRYR